MLKWSAIFFVIAIIAAVFGFTGIAAGAASIAKTLFFILIVIWLVLLVLGMTIFKKTCNSLELEVWSLEWGSFKFLKRSRLQTSNSRLLHVFFSQRLIIPSLFVFII
jgi:uncharacterized membrane protein YtjA (UPF0391 family)